MARPADGYNFGSKRQYRRALYAFVDRRLWHRPLPTRRVLILEDSEGLEAEFLIRRGYRAENITAVNTSAAVLAHTTRRLRAAGLPGVQTVAGDVVEVAQRQQVKGLANYDVINLDFTGGVTADLLYAVHVICGQVVRSDSVFAVTVLRGREADDAVRTEVAVQGLLRSRAGAVVDMATGQPAPTLRAAQQADIARLLLLYRTMQGYENDGLLYCHFHLVLEKPGTACAWGTYRSTAGTQTMLWAAAHLRAHVRGEINRLDAAAITTLMQTEGIVGLGAGLYPFCWAAIACAYQHGHVLTEPEVGGPGYYYTWDGGPAGRARQAAQLRNLPAHLPARRRQPPLDKRQPLP